MKHLLPPLLFLIFIGCNFSDLDFDNIQAPKLDGTYAIPLGYVDYTFLEMIKDVNDPRLQLAEDSTSLIILSYRDTLVYSEGSELIEINNINNEGVINLTDTTNISPNVIGVAFDSAFTFYYPSKKNEALDSIYYQDGELRLEISKTFPYDLVYDVSIANTVLEATNEPVRFQGTLTQSAGANSLGLAPYMTRLSYNNNKNTFKFDVGVSAVLGPGESISSSDLVKFRLIYRNQTFDGLYGKFGRDTANIGNQVVNIDFFEKLGKSGLKFGHPSVNFEFDNTYGVPLGLQFDGVYGVKGDSLTGDTTYLLGPITKNLQLIQASKDHNLPFNDSVIVDTDNSTLRDLLFQAPNKLGFDIKAITNPDDTTTSNFLLSNSKVQSYLDINLPMEISLSNLTRVLTFDLGDGLDFNEADSIAIRVISDNEFPFSAQLEFEIQTDSGEVLYAVPKYLILDPPFVDEKGIVQSPRSKKTDIPIGKSGIEAFNKGGKLVIKFFLNTPGTASRERFYKMLSTYRLKLNVSIMGKIDYQF